MGILAAAYIGLRGRTLAAGYQVGALSSEGGRAYALHLAGPALWSCLQALVEDVARLTTALFVAGYRNSSTNWDCLSSSTRESLAREVEEGDLLSGRINQFSDQAERRVNLGKSSDSAVPSGCPQLLALLLPEANARTMAEVLLQLGSTDELCLVACKQIRQVSLRSVLLHEGYCIISCDAS